MSDSQAYEEVTVTSDGVTVVKRFEEDEFPVPAIAFEFESDRDESVTVRMSDTVPDQIEVEDLGFHPEYGSEYWTIDDETITFERELEAGGSYTTVYGIRATGSDDVEQFLTEPTIDKVDPPLPEEEKEDEAESEDIVPETDDDVVKDAIAGDGEIPGLEEDDGESGGEEAEDITLNLNDPNDEGSAGAQADSESNGTESADVTLESGSLAGALANEIRQQNVSGEDLKLLRRALDVAAEKDGSSANQARLDQLQSDISDLRAYTSALEEFLEENGTGEEIIEEFEGQLESFDNRLESVQNELDSNSEKVGAVSSEIDEISDTVSAVDEQMDDLTEEVDGVSGEMETVKGDVDEVKEDVTEVQGDVTDVSDEIDSLDSSIDEIETTVSELEDQVSGIDVDERVEDIEADIDELQTWQDQIKETFGG